MSRTSQGSKSPRKRSIEHGDAPNYRGIDQIQEYYYSANVKMNRKVFGKEKVQLAPYPEDSQRHFLTLWFSGARESEALTIKPGGWKWNEEAITYDKLLVLKKHEPVKDANGGTVYKAVVIRERQPDGSIQDRTIYRKETQQKMVYRKVILPRDYPLAEEFLDIVQDLQDNGFHYMLYARSKFSRTPIKERACTCRTVQNRIVELHPELFPHAIRALQARYLRDRYGRDFDTPELMARFKWASAEMAVLYLGAQKEQEIMGIKKLP